MYKVAYNNLIFPLNFIKDISVDYRLTNFRKKNEITCPKTFKSSNCEASAFSPSLATSLISISVVDNPSPSDTNKSC